MLLYFTCKNISEAYLPTLSYKQYLKNCIQLNSVSFKELFFIYLKHLFPLLYYTSSGCIEPESDKKEFVNLKSDPNPIKKNSTTKTRPETYKIIFIQPKTLPELNTLQPECHMNPNFLYKNEDIYTNNIHLYSSFHLRNIKDFLLKNQVKQNPTQNT